MHNWDVQPQKQAESPQWRPDLWIPARKAKQKPLERPLTRKTVNKKQPHIPEGSAGISAAKHWKEEGVVTPTSPRKTGLGERQWLL